MMSKKKRFGVSQALTRGLTETIHVVENNSGMYRNVVIPLTRLELDPDNPRKLTIALTDIKQGLNKHDPLYTVKLEELEKLKELGSTIESSGLINPIVVYKRGEVYRVVAGERRCLASILIDKNEIEARVFNEKPQPFELKLIQWIENTAREDLTLDERIHNLQDILEAYQLKNEKTPVNATLLKNMTGLSLSQATYYLAVMNAPSELREMIACGKIRSLDKAAIIATIKSREKREEALVACINGCSLKDLRKFINTKFDTLSKKKTETTAKRGRTLTRINMGFTLNSTIVQVIINTLLTQSHYTKYARQFSDVDWNHIDQSTQAFRKMISILEQEHGA